MLVVALVVAVLTIDAELEYVGDTVDEREVTADNEVCGDDVVDDETDLDSVVQPDELALTELVRETEGDAEIEGVPVDVADSDDDAQYDADCDGRVLPDADIDCVTEIVFVTDCDMDTVLVGESVDEMELDAHTDVLAETVPDLEKVSETVNERETVGDAENELDCVAGLLPLTVAVPEMHTDGEFENVVE